MISSFVPGPALRIAGAPGGPPGWKVVAADVSTMNEAPWW